MNAPRRTARGRLRPRDGLAVLALTAALAGASAQAFEDCCNIVALEPDHGIVAAQDLVTGKRFAFKVQDRALLERLRPGMTFGVTAGSRFSLRLPKALNLRPDQVHACCEIVSGTPPSGLAAGPLRRETVQRAAEPQVITWAASPLSAVVVTPLTLGGFPEIESIGIHAAGERCQRGWGRFPVAQVKQAGEKTLVTPGTYDIVIKAAGTSQEVKLAAQLEVKPKQTVTVHSNMAIAAIKVPGMEGIEHEGVYVLRPGSRRDTFAAVIHGGHENGAKESGAVIPVEPDCLYDVFLDTGQDTLLPLAEGVMAKQGGLMVIQ